MSRKPKKPLDNEYIVGQHASLGSRCVYFSNGRIYRDESGVHGEGLMWFLDQKEIPDEIAERPKEGTFYLSTSAGYETFRIVRASNSWGNSSDIKFEKVED